MIFSPALRSATIASLDSKRSLEHKKLREKSDCWLTIVTNIENAIQQGSHSVVTLIPYDDFISFLESLGYKLTLYNPSNYYHISWK